MLMQPLPQHVLAFVTEVASLESVSSVWLFGSRANGKATGASDTDLLVFGGERTIDELRAAVAAPNEVDCLVVYDGDAYSDPWQEKRGSLSNLRWEQLSETEARYVGGKWVPDEESAEDDGVELGQFVEFDERAIRLWPDASN